MTALLAGPLRHLALATTQRYVPDPQTRTLQAIAQWLDARYGPQTRLLHPAIGIVGWETDLAIVDQAGLVTPGLQYYDGGRHTPVEAALAGHRPDLVLFLGQPDPALAAAGYRPVAGFAGFGAYGLWEATRPP